MALSITPLAGGRARDVTLALRLLLEAALVAGAVALALPWFALLAGSEYGRDGRFATTVAVVAGLPPPVLPQICADVGALAEPAVGVPLCADATSAPRAEALERMPPLLARAQAAALQAFLAPVRATHARVDALRAQQRDGTADLLAIDNAVDGALAELEPYLERYGMAKDAQTGPPLLACAYARIRDALARGGARHDPASDAVRANAVLLLAAALDGETRAEGLVDAVTLPASAAPVAACGPRDLPEALRGAAALMHDARGAPLGQLKNDATRDLLHVAGWQWAGAAALGLVLLTLCRSSMPRFAGCATALAAWALAAWIARVPWPFASEHALVLARSDAAYLSRPAPFVLAMLAAAACLLVASPWLDRLTKASAMRPASVLAYPGVVLATGIGWLLLLDLSANGHFANRYLALYHQGHLWLALTTLSVAAFMRQPLGRGLAWVLSMVDGVASRVVARAGGVAGAALLLALTLAVTLALALLLQNKRQLTSEIGRLWLIVGAAWFFFLRGTPLTERLARTGGSLASLLRYAWPLLFVVVVLVAAMLLTRDMGPLLIAGYGAGALVAGSLAMWSYQRGGAPWSAYALAALLFAAWIAVTTTALFKLGAVDDVTAARLENAAAPLASANDHLALVTWFQRAAPPTGFRPGNVPWCGFGASRACPGVPAQIQSDYTFTALVGMFGWTSAWLVTLGTAAWLYALVRRHALATRGEPRLVRMRGRMVNDDQAFVSWIAVAWVALTLCQLAVTVAGNLAVIPLTGVTFPFVSFGMTSLVANMALLGLAVNVNATEDERDA